MSRAFSGGRWLSLAVLATLTAVGCQSIPHSKSQKKPLVQPDDSMPELNLPKELVKVSLPPYMVETPDVLIINATRLIPLPPYRVQPLDQIYVIIENSLSLPNPADRINNVYPIDIDGTINLGISRVPPIRVVDLTTDEIAKVIARQVAGQFVGEIKLTVSLAASRGVQIIQGEHLVNPDGTVSLGMYGSVYVAGQTLPQIKQTIEQHLSKTLYKPEVSVDVLGYNSKFYYVITDFAGNGEQVAKLPITGNETVLDAIANIGGLSSVSSKRLWIARPAPAGTEDQILPVDWKGITRRGHTRTNYQILPGDRVFVMGQPLTKFDTLFGRLIAPAERAAGFSLLGFSTFKTFETSGNFLFGGGGGSN